MGTGEERQRWVCPVRHSSSVLCELERVAPPRGASLHPSIEWGQRDGHLQRC